MLNSIDYGYLIGPRIQIVDADGKPMTGAWLRVFIAGTTTDANTFSDWEGTVQPAKKILDARGETTIIAAVSGAYKIMLCDSTHPVSSPYWYADNVLLANISGLDVTSVSVDAEVGKLTVTVVTDTLGIKHYVVGIDPAYTAEREAAEAAAKTEVAPGTNVHVNSSTAADGHKVYTVSTGQKKYSLFVNSAGTSNLYAKIATCDPSNALIAGYGWINGSFLATEFNGAATIFAMNIEKAINGQAYSGDINAYFEGRNLSSFSYANSSNLEEIRLYENTTTKVVELWVKLKTGYKNCQTAFAMLENDANNGTPLATTPWVLAENPTLVRAWPEGLSDRVDLSHSENQAKSIAYLDTQIMPGDNVTVVESVNAYGKHVYTITGSAPNVSVTSTDGSLDITENSTPTSKTIDISVKRSFSDFVGTFSATLSNNVVVNSLVKTSGSMPISGTGVALPAGSYHVDVVCKAGTPTFTTNTSSALIIVNETATGRSFSFSANPNVVEPQMFAFGIDVKLTENKILSISSLTSADSSQEWTLNGTIFVHSINGISSGSSGLDDHLVLAGPSDTTPGTLFEKLIASGMTHLYDRGTSVEINAAPTVDSTLTGLGTTSSPLGVNNPLWYVKGNTVYGGTVVTDVNALTHNGFYTALGTATGVPNSSYSWFIQHQNSNTGTVYAQQTAYAYVNTSIICYERVKASSTWGSWTLRSSGGSDDHKLLVSATDSTPGYLFDKVESTTLTINYSVDGNGVQKLDMNVVNQASGYPNNYEPFFPSAFFTKLGNEMYAGIASPNLTRGWFFSAPRSMNVANLGIYLKGEPSPSGIIQLELALKDVVGGTVKKTALITLNAANFINLSSGGIYSIPLTEPLLITGTNPYVLYMMLKASDGTTQLSTVGNLEFMEVFGSSSESIQIECGIYSQYSSQNFEGYGDTSYSNTSGRPYMFISE